MSSTLGTGALSRTATAKSILPPVGQTKADPKKIAPDDVLQPHLQLRKGKSTARNLGPSKIATGQDDDIKGLAGGEDLARPQSSRSIKSQPQESSRSVVAKLPSKKQLQVSGSVRELKPLIRSQAKLYIAQAAKRARIRAVDEPIGLSLRTMTPAAASAAMAKMKEKEEEQSNGTENSSKASESFELSIRNFLDKGTFKVHLIQLGSSYRVAFSAEFLNLVGQYATQLSVFLVRGKAKSKMTSIEEKEESGKMNKAEARVIFLGNLEQCLFDESKVKETPLDLKGDLDHNFFFGDLCIELDQEYPTIVSKPLEWCGLVIAKRAEARPVSLYPAVFFYGNLTKISEQRKNPKKKDALIEAEDIQNKMRAATTWEKGLGLRSIRKLLRAKLRYFDRNGSGTIDFEEFKAAMENLGLFLTETRLQKLFQACDLDRSGTVELDELPLALHINDQLRPKTRLSARDAFELFDYDGSGAINEQEFYEVMNTLPLASMTREKAAKLFSRHDKDHSGEIEYDEFREIWISLCDVNHEISIRIKEQQAREEEELQETMKDSPTEDLNEALKGISKIYEKKLKSMLRGTTAQRKKRLCTLVIEEEEEEASEFDAAKAKAYADAQALRLEIDNKRRAEKLQRRREAVAAKVEISKAERELRRQKKLELSQRKRIEERERKLRAQLNKEIRYREEKERADRRAERELRLHQEKEARARRGDDRLDLPNKGLRVIPETIYRGPGAQDRLTYLVSINLSHNKLESLPKQGLFFWCGGVRKLQLGNNRLTSLPAEIEALESLEILDLVHNRLRFLPKEVGTLKKLVILNVAENELEAVPEQIATLNLRSLQIYKNAIKSLPENIGQLQTLNILDVSLNALRELPDTIAQLENLQTLDISWNSLQKLPSNIGHLKNLQSLILSGNDLRRLPDSFQELHALQVLMLGHNDLIEVPTSIQGLVTLFRLDVSRNRIVRLPREIGRLRTLQHLQIANNMIRTLPPEIGRLRYLVALDAQSNLLTQIPEEIGAMGSLVELDFSHNKIEGRLPTSIGALRNLVKLNLSENKVSMLPASMGALLKLKELNLNGNALTAMPGTIGCWNLEKLLLSRNHIVELPAAFGNLCDTLEVLDLSSNVLEFLPSEMSSLSALRHLDLHHNRLKAIPPSLAKILHRLETFRVTHNPLSKLPAKFANDVAAGGPRSELLWSGYSDGQVADWAFEVQYVVEACRCCIDLQRVLTSNADPDRQSFWEFSNSVKARLEPEGRWRDDLMAHVNAFFFKTKALGEIPRFEALYGVDVINREETIEKREAEREEIASKAKADHIERELRMKEVYAVGKDDFYRAETKINRNVDRLRREEEARVKKELESTIPIYERQETIYIVTKQQREDARKKQLEEWLSHIHEKHNDFIQELIDSEKAREETEAATIALNRRKNKKPYKGYM